MPISEYIKRGVNPFTKQVIETLDYETLCPKADATFLVALDVRKPKRNEEVHRASRFGGEPLLPAEVAWPEGPEGPLGFVGQLDFEQLCREHKRVLPLPSRGLLSVFFDIENQPWGHDPEDARSLKLVYVADPSHAQPRESEDDDPVPLRLLQPHFENNPGTSRNPDHHVWGSPAWIQGDPRLDLQLMTRGLDRSVEGMLRGLRAAEEKGVDVVSIAKGAGDWKLLWQIDSDDALFTWGDCGRIYILIREDDLAAHRFDEARCILQCT
jgi:hypothetical protein